MTKFTRRDVFSAAAGAAAIAALPLAGPVRAATPAAGKQAAGWYRYKIGTIEVTVATDGVARFKMAEDHVINIKKDVVNAALAEVFMEKDMMTTPYNPICLNIGSKLVVIDTGTGEANYKKSNGVGGQFITNLAASGIERSAVDTVIISHYHGDHINGLLMADNSLTYPNAAENSQRHRRQGDEVRLGQGSGARYHRARNARPHAGAHLVRGGLGLLENPGPVRRHQHSGILPAQSRLARGLRRRPDQGRRDAPQILRHGGGREGDRGRLPLPVPVHRVRGEGRHRLPAGPGRVESHDLSFSL